LDLSVHWGTHHLQLEIYRKPTQTDMTIHFSSNHPFNQKLAAYSFYINRMLTLPITHQAQTQEWNTICTTARNNGFPLQLIYNLRNQIIKKHTTHDQNTNPDNRTWATFTYFSPLVYKVTNLFRNTRINIAFQTTNTILHQLQLHQNLDASEASGIYRLLCNTCNRSYVGQSGRAVAVRFKEYIRYIWTNTPTSPYALHILNQQHEYGCLDENLQLLKTCDKGNLMNLWETF
jgi:hypothetical protein